jgi:hypothetical protein
MMFLLIEVMVRAMGVFLWFYCFTFHLHLFFVLGNHNNHRVIHLMISLNVKDLFIPFLCFL